VVHPFNYYRYDNYILLGYRVNQPPSIWQVVLPQIIDIVFPDVFPRYEPSLDLDSAKWVTLKIIEGPIEPFV
jgi:hypothetical protein